MALTPSHRPTREWPLLILALALVGALCVPMWQYYGAARGEDQRSKWTGARVAQLLLGPEQILSYCAFTWACFILVGRYAEVRRQRRAFDLGLLPTETGARIPYEDARLELRKVEDRARPAAPSILATMIKLALSKYAISRSARDAADTVRTQADVELGRMVSSMATVHYLAWAIPSIGFLGTVRGLAGALTYSSDQGQNIDQFIAGATSHLNIAFDCTLVALFLSLILMFLVHTLQRDEEALVLDCQQYCLEHLIGRLYDEGTETHPSPSVFSGH